MEYKRSPQRDVRYAIEGCLADAHKAIFNAARLSSSLANLELHDELQLYLAGLESLQVDLLRGARPRTQSLRRRAYLSSLPRNDGRSSS